jgi:glycosyltransferase involved in cell wall biosynthesis
MLMVSPAAPWPATTGGLVRIGAVLREMARHFDVTFVSPRPDTGVWPADVGARFAAAPIGEPGVVRKVLAIADPSRPFHAAMYARPQIARIIRRELAAGDYDVIYSHFIYGAQYLRDPRVPVIIDQQNVDRDYWQNKAEHSPFPMNAYAAWNTRRTVRYEARMLPRIWAYVSVSDEDRRRTREYAADVVPHFWVAPNGVDTAKFRPGEGTRVPNRLTLGYLGSMDLQMNVDAVQRFGAELLPQIRQTLPGMDVQFVVIGRSPVAAVRTLASRTAGMMLTGTVDDVVPWLQQLDILVSPLRIGAGTKLKVAEAMACGLPVVGSPLAFAGMPGRSGEHFACVDSDAGFVDAVCRLAKEPRARAAMGMAARELTERALDWTGIGARLADEIRAALPERSAAR